MDTTSRVVRILVADDHVLIKKGLCSLLQEHAGWVVCGEAAGGTDALEKAAQLNPDVVLIDVSMPDVNGFEVARRIHEQLPGAKILMVTEYDLCLLQKMEPPGVHGYVLKSRAGSDLISAIEAALKGQARSASTSHSS